jgi:Fe-S-cluster containining protein
MLMSDFKRWVMEAAANAEVRSRVQQLYKDLQARIDLRRPLCELSGRCCNFDRYGHRLYVTTGEMSVFVADYFASQPSITGPAKQGACPFQVGKMCRVHSIRPFGCRIFFCDPTSTNWQQEQYENFHAELKVLHRELSIPYAYIEWRQALLAMGWPQPVDTDVVTLTVPKVKESDAGHN